MIRIEVANQQSCCDVDDRRLEAAARKALEIENCFWATISIAVVDDDAIQALNRRYLQHDYATDVLSFVLEREEELLEGEVVVSAQTAMTQAASYGWSVEDELRLYVVHGVLHLVGYEDSTAESAARMRAQESRVMAELGVTVAVTRSG